jgi:hypothetical protein
VRFVSWRPGAISTAWYGTQSQLSFSKEDFIPPVNDSAAVFALDATKGAISNFLLCCAAELSANESAFRSTQAEYPFYENKSQFFFDPMSVSGFDISLLRTSQIGIRDRVTG